MATFRLRGNHYYIIQHWNNLPITDMTLMIIPNQDRLNFLKKRTERRRYYRNQRLYLRYCKACERKTYFHRNRDKKYRKTCTVCGNEVKPLTNRDTKGRFIGGVKWI